MTREYYLKHKDEMLARRRAAYASNKERGREYQKEQRRKIKREVFDNYGGKCACCGETRIVFLSIDHIDGNGGPERRLHRSEGFGTRLYHRLKKCGYPAGYQLLCFNCNWSKSHGGCPHKNTDDNFYRTGNRPNPLRARNTCRI